MNLGSVLHEQYRIGRIISCNDVDVTYLAWDMIRETKVVIREYLPKVFSARSSDMVKLTISGGSEEQFKQGLERFITEAELLKEYQSESGIVRVFDSFEENNTAYIVMEYLEGKILPKYLEQEETPKPVQALTMLVDVLKIMETVGKGDIIKSNVAPENILVTKSGEVKLIRL